MFGWLKRRRQNEPSEAATFMEAACPAITRDEHAGAKLRLEEARNTYRDVPGLGRIADGVVFWDDLRLAHGYACVAVGYDRFGWPKGHPDSPLQATSIGTS